MQLHRVKYCKSDELASLITYELNRWSDDISDKVKAYGEQIATEGKTMLQSSVYPAESSMGTSMPSARRQWNKYARSWSVKDRSGKNYSSFYIHNKNHYRLTHLLEKGHATRNGGRTRAFEHIAPVDEWCRETYLKGVEEILGGKE